MKSEPVQFSSTFLDFIHRRSRPFIEPHKSLETIVAGAYIQGMNDALDAMGHFGTLCETEDPMTETQARAATTCIGCDKPTDCPGGLVCWTCFKRHSPKHPQPLKYSNLSFEQWQYS